VEMDRAREGIGKRKFDASPDHACYILHVACCMATSAFCLPLWKLFNGREKGGWDDL
jgi:hypothetical protein